MKDKVKKYVEYLFEDASETQQLRELKEEISANLLEKIDDLKANGKTESEAFTEAVATLGDTSELLESLGESSIKESSLKKDEKISFNTELNQMGHKHFLAYIIAVVTLLLGMLAATIVYLQSSEMNQTIITFMPFGIVSLMIFTYFHLTQRSELDNKITGKRAFAYSIAIGLFVIGFFATTLEYLNSSEFEESLTTLLPFFIPSMLIYIYLRLTERKRIKGQFDPHILMGTFSGALWVFSIALFFIVGFSVSWKYSWLVFVLAMVSQLLLVAFFGRRFEEQFLDYKETMGVLSGALWVLAFTLFFIVGFSLSWKYSWLVFVLATSIQLLLTGFFVGNHGK